MKTATAPVQVCESCGYELGPRDASVACPRCGDLLSLKMAPPSVRGAKLRSRFDNRHAGPRAALAGADDPLRLDQSGVWRFREFVLPDVAPAEAVSYPEGNTPLLAGRRAAEWSGAHRLLLKHEGMNPTGSFKDRGMTVALTQAKRLGASAVACASTGNTSSSLAAYAALAGIPALVLVPAGKVSLGKLAQTLAYGARTLLVRGDFDDCLRLAREASATLGVYLVNSVNPYRIAGQKTIVLELLQQLGWQAPDWIAVPAGNLGNTAAFGAALRDAMALGLIDRVPRIAAVQAAGSAPFAASFATNFSERKRVQAETVATAIRIGDPASYDRAVRTIRETKGEVLAVSDDEILAAKAMIDTSGYGCEPASAASVAGVRALVRRGVMAPGETVVAILTGNILKDPDVLMQYHRDTHPVPEYANRPTEIEPDVREVESVLTTMARRAAE